MLDNDQTTGIDVGFIALGEGTGGEVKAFGEEFTKSEAGDQTLFNHFAANGRMPAVIVGAIEEGLHHIAADKVIGIGTVGEHIFKGVVLAFGPEFSTGGHITGNPVYGAVVGGDDDLVVAFAR